MIVGAFEGPVSNTEFALDRDSGPPTDIFAHGVKSPMSIL